tara:strand:- start:416 stop:817 length:402 start_codon:yes stop_codon:yes gene_type:complete
MATGLTKKDFLTKVFRENNLTKEDFFKHQHYTIITRSGIEKIQANNKIVINYILEKCEANFCVVKAIAKRDNAYVETYGSALKGQSHKDGSTNTWYVAEMAEKRAFSRAVLKIMGMYEHGVFGEDESESFKKA